MSSLYAALINDFGILKFDKKLIKTIKYPLVFLRTDVGKNAKTRAEIIAEYSGGKLGRLESATMGIFQITGQNSKENYSWGR